MIKEVVYKRANRQYVPMERNEIWDFVRQSNKMIVAFSMSNGFAHASPVWFCTFGSKIFFRAQSHNVKVKLAKQGKVCCLFETGTTFSQLSGVIIWGKSRIVVESPLQHKVQGLMNEKYIEMAWKPNEMPSDWIRRQEQWKKIFVEVTPKKISSWDNSRITG